MEDEARPVLLYAGYSCPLTPRGAPTQRRKVFLTMVTAKLMTVADFEAMAPDGRRYELIRGELREMAAAGGEHGTIGFEVGAYVWDHVKPRRLGRVFNADTGFVLAHDPDVVYMPDVAFVRADQLPPLNQLRGFVPFPPDLVVEVVSPTDRFGDVAAKVAAYLAAGVRLVWVVEPRHQTVTVHAADHSVRVLGADDTLDGGDVLPDFRVAVAELFAE